MPVSPPRNRRREVIPFPPSLKLLMDYAAHEGFAVVQEYVDVETAKRLPAGPVAARILPRHG